MATCAGETWSDDLRAPMTMTRMTMTRRVMFRRMGWTGTCPAPGPTESSGGRAQQGHDEKAAAPPGTVGSLHLTPTTRRPCRPPPPWSLGRRPPSSSRRVRGAARSATEKSRRPRCSADRRCSNCSHRSVPAAPWSHTRSINWLTNPRTHESGHCKTLFLRCRTTTPALYEMQMR